MIIDLKAIDLSPRHFDLIFDANGWLPEDKSSQIVGLDEPLKCQINITRVGVKYMLDGNLIGSVIARCDRCIESYPRRLDHEFRIFLATDFADAGTGELELSEDDMHVHFVSGSEIDLDDIVREQIYLSLPMKSLCSEECAYSSRNEGRGRKKKIGLFIGIYIAAIILMIRFLVPS